MRKILFALCCALYSFISLCAADDVNHDWQRTVIAAIDSFPTRGGYYTGGRPNATFSCTTLQGLHRAFKMSGNDKRPQFNARMAQPSFCSSATYALLLKALLMWDKEGKISTEAWRNMKPYVGIKDELNPSGMGQDDGVGVWGRANANGPGLAVLVHELGAGYSFSAFRGAKNDSVKETADEPYLTDDCWRAHDVWHRAKRGDVMKIFWNRNESRGHDGGAIIGVDDVKGHLQEAGHSVIFLGMTTDGRVAYWSSNGPGTNPEYMGYSVATCDPVAIQRVVFTRITHPERFDNARHIAPTDVNRYLYDLNGHRHSTGAEMKRMIGEK